MSGYQDDLPLVLYGAGRAAKWEKSLAEKSTKSKCVCFVDADSSKQGTNYLGLPVLSMADAIGQYGKFNIYVTLSPPIRYEIFDYLIQWNIQKEQIINYMEEYFGCASIETEMQLVENGIAFCCTCIDGVALSPITQWSGGGEETTVLEWVQVRNQISLSVRERKTNFCNGCKSLKKDFYRVDKKIRKLVIGYYSPCQLSCTYCYANALPEDKNNAVFRRIKLTALVEQLESLNLIAGDALIACAAGEITIAPYKKEVYTLGQKYRLYAATNAVIFDQELATIVARNSSTISVSPDAGTRETYKLIKGLDAFEEVWGNIEKYISNGVLVSVKYIFLPENSNDADVEGFIQKIVSVGVKHIILSSEYRQKLGTQQLYAIDKMSQLCKTHNISVDYNTVDQSFDAEYVNNTLKNKEMIGGIM